MSGDANILLPLVWPGAAVHGPPVNKRTAAMKLAHLCLMSRIIFSPPVTVTADGKNGLHNSSTEDH